MAEGTRTQMLNTMLRDFVARGRLDSWTSFVEELHVPSELVPALASGRAELVRLAKPRALTEDEAAALYRLIAGLVDTNTVLRQHAEQLATLVDNWAGSFKALASIGRQIVNFARFQPVAGEHEEG